MAAGARNDPIVVVQLSDLHVGADWGGGDALSMLSAAVEGALALNASISGVLVSGDLADHATDEEYEQARGLLARLEAPLYVLPGNHDDRGALRRHFDVPGGDGEPVQYSVELGALRLVVLDSTRPHEDHGELDAARLAWLDETLGAAPATPALVALHHTPLRTGVTAVDDVGLRDPDRRALAAVIERHPQILRVAGGHIHRTIAGTLGGRPVLAAPSTYVRARLRFASGEIAFAAESSGLVVHTLLDGELVSQVEPVVV